MGFNDRYRWNKEHPGSYFYSGLRLFIDWDSRVLITHGGWWCQSVVPLTMIASIVVFRRRYWITHFLGAAVVIGGVVRAPCGVAFGAPSA
jgi:hypothetical protein